MTTPATDFDSLVIFIQVGLLYIFLDWAIYKAKHEILRAIAEQRKDGKP